MPGSPTTAAAGHNARARLTIKFFAYTKFSSTSGGPGSIDHGPPGFYNHSGLAAPDFTNKMRGTPTDYDNSRRTETR